MYVSPGRQETNTYVNGIRAIAHIPYARDVFFYCRPPELSFSSTRDVLVDGGGCDD